MGLLYRPSTSISPRMNALLLLLFRSLNSRPPSDWLRKQEPSVEVKVGLITTV